jgi:hypothetical protein
MLRLKDLELVFLADHAIQTSGLKAHFLALNVLDINSGEAHVDHDHVVCLKLEAPCEGDIGRYVWSLIRGTMMMELSFVLNDHRRAKVILFSIKNGGGVLLHGSRTRMRQVGMLILCRGIVS